MTPAFFFIFLFCFRLGVALNVFGYLPEWHVQDLDYREVFRSGLTHVIFFSLEIDPVTGGLSGTSRVPTDGHLAQIRREAAEEGVKLMVCVGGGGRSAGFPFITRDKIKRTKFLNELNSFLTGHKFSGVDFNWERPIDGQWRDFGKLIKDAKQILLSGKAIVTFSYHPADQTAAESAISQNPDILRSADFALGMAYDYGVLHSSVEVAHVTKSAWIQAGLDLRKLVIGTAFYERHKTTYEDKG